MVSQSTEYMTTYEENVIPLSAFESDNVIDLNSVRLTVATVG